MKLNIRLRNKLKMKLSLTAFATSAVLITTLFSSALYAHVMVAQKGTLNVAEDGVYMVISLPVSAFTAIDDDNDGKLSAAEFTSHRLEMIKTVHSKITLKDENGLLTLQGIMLSPVTSHHSPQAPASQLVVMGRFALTQANSALEYQVNLFGKGEHEDTLAITATRKGESSKHVFELSDKNSKVSLFTE